MGGGVRVAPGAAEEGGTAFGPGSVAERLDLVLRGKAFIGMALGQEVMRHLGMTPGARELADRLAIVIEAKPGKPVENRPGRLGRGARAVGILDPQQEPAPAAPRSPPSPPPCSSARNNPSVKS